MPITLIKDKFKHRASEIRTLLFTVVQKKDVAVKIAFNRENSIIIAAFKSNIADTLNYRDWFFKCNEEYRAKYFEIWTEEVDIFILQKAYFELIKDNNEVLSLHIDPLDQNTYKMGPHIHVKSSNIKISKAHIALNLYNIDKVVNSFNEFTNSYKSALTLINHEILK